MALGGSSGSVPTNEIDADRWFVRGGGATRMITLGGVVSAMMPVPRRAMLKDNPFQLPTLAVLKTPVPLGAKSKYILQESPGLSVLPWQSCEALNGDGTAPPNPLITTAERPTLVIVLVCVGALVPTWTSPKSSPVGVMSNRGSTPVPRSVTFTATTFQVDELVVLKTPVP